MENERKEFFHRVFFKEHEVDWSNEKITRFWKFYNDRDSLDNLCFSYQSGPEVIRIAQKFLSLSGNILDYGAGKGFLTGQLLEKTGGTVSGCDFSCDLVETVNKKFYGNPRFKGCIPCSNFPTTFPPGSFDSIFLLEVIEHLPDRFLRDTLSELARLLKPGGSIVLTTRNEEKIEEAKVICPDCGAIFHKIQHVRSFSRESLIQVMGEGGFCPIFCKALNIVDFKSGGKSLIRRFLRFFIGGTTYLPNLIFIGHL